MFTTFIGPQASGCFETLSSRIVCENAGHGEECSNFDMLENNSWPHSEHTYIPENEERGTVFYIFTAVSCYSHMQPHTFFHSPGWKWFLYSSPPEKEQWDISSISVKSHQSQSSLSLQLPSLGLKNLRAQIKCQQLRDSCVMPDPSLIASTWWQFSEKLKCIPTYLHSQILEQKIHQPNEYKNIIINK